MRTSTTRKAGSRSRPGTGRVALRPWPTLGLAACLAGVCLGAAAGCHKSALRPDDARSQFDAYDATRNTRAPAHVQDAFGRRQPNLRGRLLGND